jgi:hypothetical protein
MALKLGHALGLALAIAAAASGCDSGTKGSGPAPKVAAEPVTKAPTTSMASVKPTSNATHAPVPTKTSPTNPADRVAKLGARIEREGSAIVGIDFFGTDVGDSDLEVLSNFPDLQTLGLSGTKVTDTGLVHLVGLEKLQTLKLGFTDITDHGLVTLAKLPGLQNLDLLRTKVTPAGIADLQKALPRVDVSSK